MSVSVGETLGSLDFFYALVLDLERELEKQITVQDEREMETKIWGSLPEELLMTILANLPTLTSGRFRAVCKRWRYLLSPTPTFQQISSTVCLRASPAFLIGRARTPSLRMSMSVLNSAFSSEETQIKIEKVNSASENLYLIESMPMLRMYRLSPDFLAPDKAKLQTTCNSIVCCSKKQEPPIVYIGNPATRTWKRLPPTQLRFRSRFIGLAFDSSTRCCTLIAGRYSGREKRVMGMYDSGTDAWTKIEMNCRAMSIFPRGEGVYSRGKFYWISQVKGMRRRIDAHPNFNFDSIFYVAVFDIAERRWNVIRLPEKAGAEHGERGRVCYWQVTGHDGNVILVYSKNLWTWKLNEDKDEEIYRWSELHMFPRNLCEEALNEENQNKFKSSYKRRYYCPQVVVNSCGWVSVYLPASKLILFDGEGRMMQCVEGTLFNSFEGLFPVHLRAYEINNLWWPC